MPAISAVPSELPAVSAVMSESSLIRIANLKPPVGKDETFQSSAITDTITVFPGVVDAAIEDAKASYPRWGLIANLADPLLRMVRTAGVPKPLLLSISADTSLVPEIIPFSSMLPVMAVAFWCVWATLVEVALNKTAAPALEHAPVHEFIPEHAPVHEFFPVCSRP